MEAIYSAVRTGISVRFGSKSCPIQPANRAAKLWCAKRDNNNYPSIHGYGTSQQIPGRLASVKRDPGGFHGSGQEGILKQVKSVRVLGCC